MWTEERTVARGVMKEIAIGLLRFSIAFGIPLALAWLIISEEDDIRLGAFATGASWGVLLLVWVWFVYRTWYRWEARRDNGILGIDRRLR